MPEPQDPFRDPDAYWQARSDELRQLGQELFEAREHVLEAIGGLERHLRWLNEQIARNQTEFSEASTRTPWIREVINSITESFAARAGDTPTEPGSSGISLSSGQGRTLTWGRSMSRSDPLTLLRVIPIARTLIRNGFRLTLYAMEIYDNGFGIHCMIAPPAEGFEHPASKIGSIEPAALLHARDDQGNEYRHELFLGGSNYNNREQRFAVLYRPAIAADARHLYFHLEEIGWMVTDIDSSDPRWAKSIEIETALRARIAARRPKRLCDDDRNRSTVWRKLAQERQAELHEFRLRR